MSDTQSTKTFDHGSNRSRASIDMQCYRSRHSLDPFTTAIEPVNAYYPTALHYHSPCLSGSSQHYNDIVASQVVQMA